MCLGCSVFFVGGVECVVFGKYCGDFWFVVVYLGLYYFLWWCVVDFWFVVEIIGYCLLVVGGVDCLVCFFVGLCLVCGLSGIVVYFLFYLCGKCSGVG